MSKVFRITPKRIKRANGTELTPEMEIHGRTRPIHFTMEQ